MALTKQKKKTLNLYMKIKQLDCTKSIPNFIVNFSNLLNTTVLYYIMNSKMYEKETQLIFGSNFYSVVTDQKKRGKFLFLNLFKM